MITKEKTPWSFIKFFQVILKKIPGGGLPYETDGNARQKFEI